MKKILILLVPILLAFGACQKETVTLKARIQAFEGNNSKVYLNGNDCATFESGDVVNINGSSYTAVTSGSTAYFDNVGTSSTYYAAYGTNTSNTSTVQLSSVQTLETTTVGGVKKQKITAPMAACIASDYSISNGNTLRFYNLCSLIEVPVVAPSANFHLSYIKLTAATDPLWGTYTINYNGDGVAPTLSDYDQNNEYGRTVTLQCDYDFTARDTMYFYVIVPALEAAQTLTLNIQGYSINGNIGNFYYIKNMTGSSQQALTASKIVSVPIVSEFTHVETTDPYEISNYGELLFASELINSAAVDNWTARRGDSNMTFKTGTFWFMNDIDCNNQQVDPLGTGDSPFEGIFDGQNYTIDNYQLTDAAGDVGLIGQVLVGTVVKNISTGGSISVVHRYGNQINVIGGICAGVNTASNSTRTCTSPYSDTTYFINCHNGASIQTTSHTEGVDQFDATKAAHVGGVVGSIWGTSSTVYTVIRDCSNSGDIHGIQTAIQNGGTAGILGQHHQSSNLIITRCKNTGDITTYATNAGCGAGGILGMTSYYSDYTSSIIHISNCTNEGDITSNSTSTALALGGIVGYWGYSNTNNIIANCNNHGAVTHPASSGYAGGILGYSASGTMYIRNCYSNGSITGGNYRGGIWGMISSDNSNSSYNWYLSNSAVITTNNGNNGGGPNGNNSGSMNQSTNNIGYISTTATTGTTFNNSGVISSGSGFGPGSSSSTSTNLYSKLNSWASNSANQPSGTYGYSLWTETYPPELSCFTSSSSKGRHRR